MTIPEATTPPKLELSDPDPGFIYEDFEGNCYYANFVITPMGTIIDMRGNPGPTNQARVGPRVGQVGV